MYKEVIAASKKRISYKSHIFSINYKLQPYLIRVSKSKLFWDFFHDIPTILPLIIRHLRVKIRSRLGNLSWIENCKINLHAFSLRQGYFYNLGRVMLFKLSQKSTKGPINDFSTRRLNPSFFS